MRVIIVGAGEVGFHTAERLSLEGHDVIVVERDRNRLQQVEERLNVMTVEGSGARADVLEGVGIRSCDVFIAVTDIDEVNLVSCILAREYGVPTKIARVRSAAYSAEGTLLSAEKLGIDLFINPLETVAQDLINTAKHPAAVEVAEFAEGRILFVGYSIAAPSPTCGLSLADLRDLRSMYPFVIAAITRGGRTLIPRGPDTIEAGDHVFLVLRAKDLPNVRYLFGLEKRLVRRVFVLGGGPVGFRVASHCERMGLDVRVVEPQYAVCTRLAEQLDRAVVLNADITDVDTLLCEGLDASDVVVATTDDEESNILACLLAKRHAGTRALCLVDRPAYVSLVPTLGIDACISPRLSTASAIVRYLRRGGVLRVTTVEENQAEVIEVLVTDRRSWLGTPLKHLDFPPGGVVGAVMRGDDAFVPTGDTHLQPGDRAVVFALPEAVAAVEDFFGVG